MAPGHVQADRAHGLILPPYIDAGADSLEDQVLSSDIRLGIEPVGDRSPANSRQEALDHGVVEAECGEPKEWDLVGERAEAVHQVMPVLQVLGIDVRDDGDGGI